MFGVGFFELIIIAVVALVVVGPKRLPEVMKQAGRLFVHVRRTANDVRSTFEQVIREAEDELRREEANSLRQALQPMMQAKDEVRGLLNGATTPPGIASDHLADGHGMSAATDPHVHVAGAHPYVPGAGLGTPGDPAPSAAKNADAPPASSDAGQITPTASDPAKKS